MAQTVSHWVAIDVGTTKICTLVALPSSSGGFDVVGIGQYPSYGLSKGIVVDMRTTIDSISRSVRAAAAMAGIAIDRATIGISGGHIQSCTSHGVVPLRRGEVTDYDIERVLEAARAISLPTDREIIHVLPQYFRVDGQEFSLDSRGLRGVRLEAQVHLITGSVASANNLVRCCEAAGVLVEDIVLEQLASAEAVLSPTERALGVGVLDIGGGTSDFAIFKDGRVCYSKVIPIAGNHFTSDLAVGLRMSREQAEEFKKTYGTTQTMPQQSPEAVSAMRILAPRAAELYSVLLDDMIAARVCHLMPCGLILTGGGGMLDGMREMAETIFEMPVRIGIPEPRQETRVPDMLRSPIYATAFGLLWYASGNASYVLGERSAQGGLWGTIVARMRSWLYDVL